MYRDDASLLDIDTAARYILETSAGLSRIELMENKDKVFSIIYQLIVIGEATKRLSLEFRQKHSSVPWKDIAGMRDVMAHQYDKVDLDEIWDVIQRDVPALIEMISPLLS
jgi:uncharacterized protein with HEPN domain